MTGAGHYFDAGGRCVNCGYLKTAREAHRPCAFKYLHNESKPREKPKTEACADALTDLFAGDTSDHGQP